MQIISSKITKKELTQNHLSYFKTMVKVVVDIEEEIIAIDAELHSDLEELLLDNGSKQKDLWGVNLYPLQGKKDFIEYTSFINIRPSQDNYSMEIADKAMRGKIENIIEKLINYDS